jgi:hypothetical protein
MLVYLIVFFIYYQFAHPIRLLLAFTGTQFEDKRYHFIGADYDRSEWFNEKFSHSLDFPNVIRSLNDTIFNN